MYYFELLVLSAERRKVTGSSQLFEDLCAGKFDFAQHLYKAQPEATRRAWIKRLVSLVENHPLLSIPALLKKLTEAVEPRQLLPARHFIIDEAEEGNNYDDDEDQDEVSILCLLPTSGFF